MISKPRYKDKTLQKVYQGLLDLALDRSSELYYHGAEHRGAAHRCAFWDGFNGAFTLYARQSRPMTIGYVCYQAGKQYAKMCKQQNLEKPLPADPAYYAGRSGEKK
jgi:hypothetical protein